MPGLPRITLLLGLAGLLPVPSSPRLAASESGAETAAAASASAVGAAVNARSGGAPAVAAPLPRVYTPVRPREVKPKYPWRENIVTTIFWIGEQPTENNPTPNHKSSWDPQWSVNFGGYDDPSPAERAWDFRPKEFLPGLNPFYVALPYNDVLNHRTSKPEARRVIPWFKERFEREGRSVCKGQWVAIRYGKKVCYAQWEDCGPWNTDDWEYVFSGARPKNTTNNNGAALDVSPAVRDYLGIPSGALCDWRFVSIEEVPTGPWAKFGSNNHFVQRRASQEQQQVARFEELKRRREEWLKRQYSGAASGS